jgi:hypothetical protein
VIEKVELREQPETETDLDADMETKT